MSLFAISHPLRPMIALPALALGLCMPFAATARADQAGQAVQAPPAQAEGRPAVDPALHPALQRMRDTARAADSSAFLVWEDGRWRVEDYDAAGAVPVSIQSITKSVAALAIGKLWSEGRIGSIDDPVAKYLPEFQGEGRERITLRHVLTHTSGLEIGERFGLEVEQAFSFLASAVALKPSGTAPGLLTRYDNRAWQLVCGVIHSASGEDVQDYMRREIFAPMGIVDFRWTRDPSGATMCHADLHLLPRDLVKIGRLALDRGVFEGRRIVAEAWYALTQPAQMRTPMPGGIALGWQDAAMDERSGQVRVDAGSLRTMIAHGLSADTARKVQAADGGSVHDFWEMYIALDRTLQANYREARIAATLAGMREPAVMLEGEQIALRSTGGGGQFLHVDLRKRRVIVRLIAPAKVDGDRTSMPPDFMEQLLDLP